MKKNKSILQLILIITIIGLVAACSGDKSVKIDSASLNAEISNTKIALEHSKAYNDTLIMYYDTVKVRKDNAYCLKYDKLYHQNDSLFNHYYTMFGDEMYGYGYMMNNYSPGSMMGGGMMNGDMMDDELRGDTTMMNGYYYTMHQLQINHQTYHNAIYN